MDVKRLNSDDEESGVKHKRNLPAFGGISLVTEPKTITKKSNVPHLPLIYKYN